MPAAANRLVVGAAQFGQQYGRSGKPAPTDAAVEAILRLAADLGCAAIDTARAYGGSEAAIGRARRADAGAELPIVTKIRPLTEADERSGVAAAVAESLAESLEQLGAERVDTVLLHRAADLARCGAAAGEALQAACEAGLIARWGVSVADPAEFVRALTAAGLCYVQLPFNLVDRRWLTAEVQNAVSARPEVVIVARSAFLQGILLDPGAGLWPAGAEPAASTVSAALTALASETDRSRAGLCLGYVLAQPWIDAVVVGVRSAQQLAEVAAACAEAPLTAEECEWLESAIPPGSRKLVNPALWPERAREAS